MNEDINLIDHEKIIDYSYNSSLRYPKYFGGVGGHIAAVYQFYNPNSDTYYIGSTMNLNDRMSRHKSRLRNGKQHSKAFIQDYKDIIDKGEEPENVIQCELLYSKVMIEMPSENEWFETTNYLKTYEDSVIKQAISEGKKLYNILRNVPTIKIPKFNTGNVPYNAIPVICNNKVYISQTEAANALGVSNDEIKRRINSNDDKFSGYKKITQEEYTQLTSVNFRKAPDAYNATKPLKGVLKGKKTSFKSIYDASRQTKMDRAVIRSKLLDPKDKDWELL